MDANTPYQIIQYAASKNQQGYISPNDYMLIINQAQRQYFDYLKGEYQRYQIQRPIAVVEFGQNQMVRQSLAPLVYNTVLPINAITGIASFPSDYEVVDAVWGVYGFYNIRFIQQDRLDSYKHSDIDSIVENPIYLLRHEGFQFFPDRPYGENQAKMSYLRTPPSIVWGYNIDSNGQPVYNAATSSEPIWGDNDMMQIIVRALQLVGINLQAPMISQYAKDIKETGQ